LLNLGVQGVQSIRLDFYLFICWRRMDFSVGSGWEVFIYKEDLPAQASCGLWGRKGARFGPRER
jgi:hypothetical protein